VLIRYYLDEHIFSDAAFSLRQHGVDVLTTAEAQNIEKTDAEQLAFATSQGRVLVTRDKDFLELHAQGVPHAGIVRWHSKRQSHGMFVRRLLALWRFHSAEEMIGRIEYY
jgi:predicted nuclease of predicted toxin-antitoxin system